MKKGRTSVLSGLVATTALLIGAEGIAQQATSPQAGPLTRLADWSALVDAHRPGERDEAADAAGLLRATDLRRVHDELLEAARLLGVALESGASLDEPVRWNRETITVGHLAAALRVPGDALDAALASSDRSRARALVERRVLQLMSGGALLHADVALVVPPVIRLVSAVESDTKASLLVQDGRAAGVERTAESHVSTHFQFGNMLIDLALERAVPADTARLWYRATSAYLLRHEAYGDAMPYLDHARAVLPDDPVLVFYTGALHEVFALPRAQAVVQSVELPPGMEHDIGSVTEELRVAARHYRRALELDPAFTLAGVHHGRIVGLLGDPAASRSMLLGIRPRVTDRPTQYFTELFLGDAARELGDADAARGHYQRAAALYQRAQTPGLSESALLRADGEREAAVALMRKVLSRRVGRSLTDDPWWTYYMAHVSDVDDLVAALREALATGAGR
jgi:tetratricopeptide (TPR) repeat protein